MVCKFIALKSEAVCPDGDEFIKEQLVVVARLEK
jgi:hypothetical protein